MQKKLLMIFTSLLLFTQCEKDEPEPTLPPETTVGANTFGAIVNGEVWSIDISKSDFSGKALFPTQDLLEIGGGFNEERDESIGFTIYDQIIEEGHYEYSINDPSKVSFRYKRKQGQCLYDQSINERTRFEGSIEITYINKPLKIISGRFEFEIYIDGDAQTGTNSCGIIKVESGIFDLKYNN